MKKIISLMLALILCSCCALSFAEGDDTLYPFHDVDMDKLGVEDCTVHATFDPAAIDENNSMTLNIYGTDLYDKLAILALKAGDKIFINDEELTVETVEEVDSGIDINGGFISEFAEGEGASLLYVDGDPLTLWSMMLDDTASMTMRGQYNSLLADEVLISTYKMVDGDWTDEFNEVTLPASEVRAYLMDITDMDAHPMDFVTFYADNTFIRILEDGSISEIHAFWTPCC